MRTFAAALLGLALVLAGCQGAKIKPERVLVVKVDPPQVELGRRVTVTAQAVDQAELAYVSGTVAVTGMPVIALKYDAAQKVWALSTVLPVFWSIPQGSYEIKAWGQTLAGERYEGNAFIEIK